ncbi:TolB family protein [Streptomyces sp. NPDC013978]|uniref:TolB family protein n=1 Tax=Streptomyces sp. NPDC013978 TaxID=3364869 RepID=UPI0037002C40
MRCLRQAAVSVVLAGSCAAMLPANPAVATGDEHRARTERISVTPEGTQANDFSDVGGISANGRYVAFDSSATNLVAGDSNGFSDIFVKDLRTGTIERVNVADDGTQADNESTTYSLSANGRYVAFSSYADNLAPGDTPDAQDVFVHDRLTGRTEVLVESGTTWAQTYEPSISANGRYVAFTSSRSDLVPGDTNGRGDVFVRDRWKKTVERISVADDGSQTSGFSEGAAISADGTRIGFRTQFLLDGGGDGDGEGDGEGKGDGQESARAEASEVRRPQAFLFYVRDTRTGRTVQAAHTREGVSVAVRGAIELSPDGRYALYASEWPEIVPGDTNDKRDVFAKDLRTGATRRLTLAHDGSEPNDHSAGQVNQRGAALSADNRRVVFTSFADNLVPGDTNGDADAFVRDLVTGEVRRLNVTQDGGQSDTAQRSSPFVDALGWTVAFSSAENDLVPGDTNETSDVFVRRLE